MKNTNEKDVKKMNKMDLVSYVKSLKKTLRDKSLTQMIDYTVKKFNESDKNVQKNDLLDLIESILSATKLEPKPIENSVKASNKQVSSIPANKVMTEEQALREVEKVLSMKDAKKKKEENAKQLNKQVNKKEETKQVDKKDSKKSKLQVKKNKIKKTETKKEEPKKYQFPKILKLDSLDDKLKLNLKIKSIDEVSKLIEADKELYICAHWTKDLLKEFGYDVYNINPDKKFTEFPQDLDILQILYTAENKAVFAFSLYSDIMYCIKPEDMEIKDGIRYNNGLEFAIYEV